MMTHRVHVPFSVNSELKASVLELPYGNDSKICMWLMLPFYDTQASTVLDNLRGFDIVKINHALHRFDDDAGYEPNEVVLNLPRFKIESSLDLTGVLKELNISQIFDPNRANLQKLNKEFPYVSRVAHKAVIEVNEAGTIAAAVAGASVSFKQLPAEFKFNRPFNFMIVDRSTNTLLFAGQVQNPIK